MGLASRRGPDAEGRPDQGFLRKGQASTLHRLIRINMEEHIGERNSSRNQWQER